MRTISALAISACVIVGHVVDGHAGSADATAIELLPPRHGQSVGACVGVPTPSKVFGPDVETTLSDRRLETCLAPATSCRLDGGQEATCAVGVRVREDVDDAFVGRIVIHLEGAGHERTVVERDLVVRPSPRRAMDVAAARKAIRDVLSGTKTRYAPPTAPRGFADL